MDEQRKEKENFKDDFIQDIIEKGNRKISNENFENIVMQKIYNDALHKKEVHAKLKKSMYFCYLALFLIAFYAIISIMDKSSFNKGAILILFFTIIFGVIIIDNFKRFFSSYQLEID